MRQTKILLSSTLIGHDRMNKNVFNQQQIIKQSKNNVIYIIDDNDNDKNERQYTMNDLNLPDLLRKRLYEHQQEGVSWLMSIHYSSIYSGGILGDDMGLGKTFQVSCFLTGLLRENKIKAILIVCPVSVLRNWYREFENHLIPHVESINVDMILSETTKKGRSRILESTFKSRNRQIVITSYHLIANMVDAFTNCGRWDYVILDEGHTIKNPQTKISKAMQVLNSNKRLILSGTPIQNNLMEMWCLVDWVTKGNVIGNKQSFIRTYSDPILKGQDPKATPEQRRISSIAAQQLLQVLQPILLQRKKCEKGDILKLTEKNEIVIWVPLSNKQRDIYQSYIHKREVINALERANYPVEIINHLKTLCRHPYLLEASDAKSNNKHTEHDIDDLTEALGNLNVEVNDIEKNKTNSKSINVFEITGRNVTVPELLHDSVKLKVLLKLAKHLVRQDHRILIFSQAKMMLDIIQRVFADAGMCTSRIDGSVAGKERQRIIDEFNNASPSTPSICVLTTRACGYGITLTGADRVIIYDPSWNPSEDRQAVDRAYRIGQKKDVVVYRMIMASSVEEKMYEKQVFKDGLRIVTECGVSSRYFSSDETKALFTLGPIDRSLVMEKLWNVSKEKMTEYPDCGDAIQEVLGYSRHDNLYEEVRPEEIQNRNKVASCTSAIRNINPSNQNNANNNVWTNNPKYVDLTKKTIINNQFRSKTPINDDTESDDDIKSNESTDNEDNNNNDINQGPFTLALSPEESFDQIAKRNSLESLSDRKSISQPRQRRIILSDSDDDDGNDNDDEFKSCDDGIINNDNDDQHISDTNNHVSGPDSPSVVLSSMLTLNLNNDAKSDWDFLLALEDEINESYLNGTFMTTVKKRVANRSFFTGSDSDSDEDVPNSGTKNNLHDELIIDNTNDSIENAIDSGLADDINDIDDDCDKEDKDIDVSINETSLINNNSKPEMNVNKIIGSTSDGDGIYDSIVNVIDSESIANNDNDNEESIEKSEDRKNSIVIDEDTNDCDIEEINDFQITDENIDDMKMKRGRNDSRTVEDIDILKEVNKENFNNSIVEGAGDHENILKNLCFDHFKKVKVPLIGNLNEQRNVDNYSASFIATKYAKQKYSNILINTIRPKKVDLDEDSIEQYNHYILEGRSAERRKDRNMALEFYSKAIMICDEDILLHGKIAYSYNKLI